MMGREVAWPRDGETLRRLFTERPIRSESYRAARRLEAAERLEAAVRGRAKTRADPFCRRAAEKTRVARGTRLPAADPEWRRADGDSHRHGWAVRDVNGVWWQTPGSELDDRRWRRERQEGPCANCRATVSHARSGRFEIIESGNMTIRWFCDAVCHRDVLRQQCTDGQRGSYRRAEWERRWIRTGQQQLRQVRIWLRTQDHGASPFSIAGSAPPATTPTPSPR